MDGRTQTTFAGDTNPSGPEIYLDGSLLTGNVSGLSISASNVTVRGLSIGGFKNGISIEDSSAAVVVGNYIGLHPDGERAAPNRFAGVYFLGASPGARIGGPNSAERNVISGNTAYGVLITGQSSRSVITGNYIGTDRLGLSAVPTQNAGIMIGLNFGENPTDTLIGGFEPGEANLISGNEAAVIVRPGDRTRVIGNLIGTDATGRAALGNGMDGVEISGSSNCRVERNTIANNGRFGVFVNSVLASRPVTVANVIRMNSFSLNGLGYFGIQLDTVRLNDSDDSDTGANNLQNYPDLARAFIAGNSLTVRLSQHSQGVQATHSFLVDVYKADGRAAEGEVFLGQQCFVGNWLNNGVFSANVMSLTVGDKVLATTTSYSDSNCSVANDGTSEFSPAIVVEPPPPCFVLNTSDSGAGSLRQAILDANLGQCTPPGVITFNIAESFLSGGVFTIQPTSPLPPIFVSNVTLDGATQTAFTNDTNPSGPEVVINGDLLSGFGDGLQIVSLLPPNGGNVRVSNLVINGFLRGSGIYVSRASGANITGNYIGTDATGRLAAPNGNGVMLFNAQNTFIGGRTTPERNVISGNSFAGLYLLGTASTGTTQSRVLGNRIGSDPTASLAVPNTHGIYCTDGCLQSTFGDVGGDNVIAYNSNTGVAIVGKASRNRIRANSIRANGALGIDLNLDGVTKNNVVPRTGPNDLQKYPEIVSVTLDPTLTKSTIAGELKGATPNSSFTLDFFNNTVPDPSGFGEGEEYLRSLIVQTDASGNATFTFSVQRSVQWISATATSDSLADTSEFGNAVQAEPDVEVSDCPDCNLGACIQECYEHFPENPTKRQCMLYCRKYCAGKCSP